MRTEVRSVERSAVFGEHWNYCACHGGRGWEAAVATSGGNGRRCDDRDRCVCGAIGAFSTETDVPSTASCSYQYSVDADGEKWNSDRKMTQNGREKLDSSDAVIHRPCDTRAVETASGPNDFRFRLCGENATTAATSETVEERTVEGRPDSSVGCYIETSTRTIQSVSNSDVMATVDEPRK